MAADHPAHDGRAEICVACRIQEESITSHLIHFLLSSWPEVLLVQLKIYYVYNEAFGEAGG